MRRGFPNDVFRCFPLTRSSPPGLSCPLAFSMFHKLVILPSSSTFSRLARRTSLAAGVALWTLMPDAAHAYCRTTTCELTEDPREPTCARNAEGCVTEGLPIAWEQTCIGFAVNEQGFPQADLDADEFAQLVEQAFALWQGVTCPGGGHPGFTVFRQDAVSCAEQQAVCGGPSKNVNLVTVRDSWPPRYSATAAAVATPTASLADGTIVDADLELNGQFDFTTDLDPLLVVAHELGHLLGLSHSEGQNALMYANYRDQGSTGVQLGEDDIAGICAIYPPHANEESCEPTPLAYDACQDDPLGAGAMCPVDEDTTTAGCSWARAPSRGPAAPFALLALLGLSRLVRRFASRDDPTPG